MLAELEPSQDDAASDAELLNAWIEVRDRDSLEALIHRYQPLVIAVCLRQCRRRIDVEDAFQATFLQLSRSAASIQNPAALAGWLHAVAYRISVRTRNMVEHTSLDKVDVPSDDEPLLQLTRRHELQVLDEELARLPEAEKTPLVMHYLEGRTMGQIAEKLGTTVGSIRGRLQRGRKRLRGRMIRRGTDFTAAFAACELLPMQWIDAAIISAQTAEICQADSEASTSLDSNSPSSPTLPRLELLLRPEGSTMLSLPTIVGGTVLAGLVLLLGIQPILSNESPQEPATLKVAAENSQAEPPQATTISKNPPSNPFGESQDPFGGPESTPPNGSPGQPVRPKIDGISTGEIDPQMLVGDGAIRQQLQKPMRLTAERVPFQTFLDYLRTNYHLPVMVDRVALKTAEISEELYVSTPITEAQLETILKAALRPLGLQAVVKDDVLQITVDMEAHALNGGDMSTWVSVDNDEADKIVEKLSAPYSATINQLPLEDAIRQISADNDLPMIIKTRALEDEGLTRDIPITVNLKNISLASFFKIMLDDCNLELNISGNILEVTSHYDASENLLSRIYWLEGTGITPIAGVITVLQTSVDPPSWDVEGGLSTIEILMNQGQSRAAIVVRQSLTNHLEIDRFFEALRNDRKKAAK